MNKKTLINIDYIYLVIRIFLNLLMMVARYSKRIRNAIIMTIISNISDIPIKNE